MKTKSLHGLVLLVALVVIAGCGDDAPALDDTEPVATDRVDMDDNQFVPPVIEVATGTTVTWAFTDGDVAHNVVGDGFQSDVQSSGTFTHTFQDAGTYDYRCTLHPGMDGRVIVTGS